MQQLKNAHRTVMILAFLAILSAWPTLHGSVSRQVQNPAAAFPSNTLMYMQITHPVAGLDLLTHKAFWPEFVSLVECVYESEGDQFVSLEFVSKIMENWASDSDFRRHFLSLAGEGIVFGVIQTQGEPQIIVAVKGSGAGPSLEAVKRIVKTLDLTFLPDSPAEKFSILDGDATLLLEGRTEADWCFFTTRGAGEEMEKVALALSGAGNRMSPLSSLEVFQRSMEFLPDPVMVRGFLNTPRIAEQLKRSNFVSPATYRLVRRHLNQIESMGFAREVIPEHIRTWISGRILSTGEDDPIADLASFATPIREPLSRFAPADALAVYEIGAPPGRFLAALADLLEDLSTPLHSILSNLLQEFQMETNLDPTNDLFPYLGRETAVSILAGDVQREGGWFPRPLTMVRVKNEEGVRHFLKNWIQWEAGAVAAVTEGLVSAMVVHEEYEGVEMWGLQVESILPVSIPLPSPAYAIVDGLLVASPFRSAVREGITAIQQMNSARNSHQESGKAVSEEALLQEGAAEIFRIDLNRLGSECERLRLLMDPDKQRHSDVLGALNRLLQSVGQAHGWTKIHDGNRFVSYIEIHAE